MESQSALEALLRVNNTPKLNTTIGPNIPSAATKPHVVIVDYLFLIIPPFIIVFGTIGNILSILVLRRPQIGAMPTKIYMISLAVADIFSLNTSLLRVWLRPYYDLRSIHDATCKLHIFASYIALYCSSWFQVAISLDRFVGIVFPFKSLKIRPKHRAFFTALIVIVSTLIPSHVLGYFRLVYDNNGTLRGCNIVNVAYVYFIYYPWSWLTMLYEFLIPFFIISVCSIIMVHNLKHRGPLITGATSDAKDDAKVVSSKTTKLFIRLNLLFIITVSPKRIYSILMPYIPSNKDNPISGYIYAFSFLLMFMNNAINFVLYILHGPRFLATFKAMMLCSKAQPLTSSQNSTRIQSSRT